MYRKDRQNEFYTTLARKQGFPARSIYKLKEINEKHKIIKEGDRVLDLGCAPGSWLLYISQKVGDKGKVHANGEAHSVADTYNSCFRDRLSHPEPSITAVVIQQRGRRCSQLLC